MWHTITPREMKRIEAKAIANGKVTGEGLMARAAAHVAQAVQRSLTGRTGRVLFLCGTGNNGGDGIGALGLLLKAAPDLAVTLWLLEGSLSVDCAREVDRLTAAFPDLPVERIPALPSCPSGEEGLAALSLPTDIACVVDALFGTGLSRPVTGEAKALCQAMNALGAQGIPVISVDIPSGLHGESGEVMGSAVHATETITFHRPKPGLWLGVGADFCGRVTVADIGLLPEWDDAEGFALLEPSDIPHLIPPRRPVSHKGSYGRVLILAGSRGMAGAAALCALACLRTGAGLVTLACPDTIVDTVQQLCPCATCLPLPTEKQAALRLFLPALEKTDALLMGCGLGTEDAARALVLGAAEFVAETNLPTIFDADALNILATTGDFPLRFTPRQILTPHPGEAARLLGLSTTEITKDAPTAAHRLADRFGASIVLKGAASVLLSGGQAGLGVLGTPALAKGGSGDVLTGVLAALAANREASALSLSDFEILQLGCALHGLAGQAAAAVFGERGVLATDVCGFLGRELAGVPPLHPARDFIPGPFI